jgi:lipid A 3-O-deacylase
MTHPTQDSMTNEVVTDITGRSWRIAGALFWLAIGSLISGPLLAADSESVPAHIFSIGVIAHDHGPFSDHNEDGTDLNLEVQFTPLPILWSARPHLGATINFIGDTSAVYAGLTFPFYQSQRWFLDGAVGAAVHNGPMHKDPVRCREESDCGFGKRLLPRLGLEAGYRISPDQSVSFFYDHMSHKWIMAGENEGIDHIGLRYRLAF